ncbi:MAG TPA: hypothetical protein VFA22_09230, partial [Stellaceae bacterium]|nr:hypothetical protein [Stellaceae bacterium]
MKRLTISAVAALAIAMPALAQQMGGGSGSSGGGGVSSVGTACGIVGGPITGTGTVQGARLVNAQTGTSYSLTAGDCGKLLTSSNAGAVAVTLLAPGTAGNGYWFELQTLGAGTVRLTPASGTINGAAYLDVPQGQGVTVATDGSAYVAVTGLGGGAVASVFGRTGAVTAQSGDYSAAQVTGALVNANNLSDVSSVAAARVNLAIDQRTGHGDSDYAILATDHYVTTSAAFTAARTWTLPNIATVNEGDTITIADDAGGVTGTNTLTVRPNGATQTLNGVNFGSGGTLVIANARGAATCKANVAGTNWECVGSIIGSTAPAHQFANGLTAGGSLSFAQPAAADIAGLAAVASSGSASDLASGTLPAARLPAPGATTLGGVESKDCTAGGQFLQKINTDGTETCGTPAGGGNVSTAGTLASGNLVTGAGSQSVQDSGVAFPALAAHQALVATGASTLAAKTIPDCQDSGGNHLNYTQSTDAFSCGTTSSGGGGGTILRGYLAGLTLSNDGTTPNTIVDMGPGQAADDTGAAYLSLATKCQVNFGTTGAGGLDTGTIGASKSYGVFIINGTSGTSCLATLASDWALAGNGSSTGCSATAGSTSLTLSASQSAMYVGQPIQIFGAGVNGAAFNTTVASFSGTSVTLADKPPVSASFVNCDGGGFKPTLPTGYTTYKRYVGSVLSDGSSHIYGFTQKGDQFLLANGGIQTNAGASISGGSTSKTPFSIAIPHGVKVRPYMTTKASSGDYIMSDPDTATVAATHGVGAPGASDYSGAGVQELENYSDYAGRVWV